MTNVEKWNLIVDGYRRYYSALELKLQAEWETYSTELFGYKKLLGEIEAQRHVTVGSGNSIIPDIILRINKQDVFDIELKQYSLPFSDSFETQLISYLNQTHLSVGMIVCNKIYLYYYEYASVTINKIEIPFEENNADGIALMEMLTKESFSTKTIQEFILKKIQCKNRMHEIRNLLTGEWLKSVARDKLLESYSEEEVDGVINETIFETYSLERKVKTISSMETPVRGSALNVIRKWCEDKVSMGEIVCPVNFSTKKYTRFTTSDLDKFIPYQNFAKSGWNNGHFYSYEIIDYGNKVKTWIAFSQKNAPMQIKDVFNRIMLNIGKQPPKEDWQWWTIFSTQPFAYNDQTSETELYNAIEMQFGQVRAQTVDMLKKL